MSELERLFGLRVIPGFDPGEAYLVDEAELRRLLESPRLSIPIPPADPPPLSLSLRLMIEELERRPAYRPSAIIIHPEAYATTRRGFAEIAIRDALGGRRRGPGRKLRSRLPFRERRAAALRAVRDLWAQERAGTSWEPV